MTRIFFNLVLASTIEAAEMSYNYQSEYWMQRLLDNTKDPYGLESSLRDLRPAGGASGGGASSSSGGGGGGGIGGVSNPGKGEEKHHDYPDLEYEPMYLPDKDYQYAYSELATPSTDYNEYLDTE